MQPLITIIIPVYNAERYLTQCLESILKQVDTNFELILVDDGSTDDSGMILDDFVRKSNMANARILVHHQPNAGVSAARNKGIELATGEYITFVDADDWLAPDYIEQLHKLCDNTVDLVITGMYDCLPNGKLRRIEDTQVSLPDLWSPQQLIILINSKRLTGPWCKLFKTAILRDKNIRFTDGISFGEDKEFVANYISFIDSAFISSYCGYYYQWALDGCLSRKIHLDRYVTEYRIWQIWYKTIQNRNAFSEELDKRFVPELYNILADSISGSITEGYIIPKLDITYSRYLRKNLSLITDSNPIRRFSILYKCFWIYKLAYKIQRRYNIWTTS